MNSHVAMTTFVEVARSGSFSAAARKLGLSTTAVSRHVAELEQALGVTLLRRTTRNVSPTETGASYLPRAAAILEEIARLNSDISESDRAPRGNLRVTAPPAIGRDLIAPLMVDFLEAYPEVNVELELIGRVVDLVAEGFDAAIRSGPLTSSSLIAHQLVEMRYQLCASPEYVKRNGTPLDPKDLESHDFIHWSGTASVMDCRFTGNGVTTTVPLRCRLQLTDFATQKEAAFRGLGLAILPALSVHDDLEAGRLVALLQDYEVYRGTLSLVRPNTPFEPLKLRAFIDFITSALRRRAG